MSHNSNKKRTGHRWRLREKFLKGGLQGFLDYEIVELLLTLGTPRRDCKQQALDALRRFKVLRRVLAADEEELQEIKGIGSHNVFGIKLVRDVACLFLKEKMLSLPVCHSSKEVFDYLYHSLRDSKTEKFKILFLDVNNIKYLFRTKSIFLIRGYLFCPNNNNILIRRFGV